MRLRRRCPWQPKPINLTDQISTEQEGVESGGNISVLNLHGGSKSLVIGIALLFKRSEGKLGAIKARFGEIASTVVDVVSN